MSYDLYFYKRNDSPLEPEQVAAYLAMKMPFNTSEHPGVWHYENPETKVYFSIFGNEEIDEEGGAPEGFTPLNYSFNINFFRPRYFGYEAFPFIDQLVKDLDLYVLNPQEEDEELARPVKYPAGHLEHDWAGLNDRLTRSRGAQMNFGYLPLDRSDYLWQYQYNKQALEESVTENIYVPRIFVLKGNADGKLCTACVWPTHIAIILPVVDYVIIEQKYRNLFRRVEHTGLVAYDTIIAKMGTLLHPFDHKVTGLRIFNQPYSSEAKKIFNNLRILSDLAQFGTGVTMDNFVNVQA